MIHTLDIPPERWPMFMRSIDRALAERPIRVEVVGRPIGDQEMEQQRPFHGIDYDSKGSERGTITITVATDDGGEATHRIIGPTRVYLAQDERGEFKWLAIEEAGEVGDVRTIVHFERLAELEAEYREGPPAP